MARIDYYFSLMSPFTYLAGDRLERIAARHGAGVRYRPIDAQAVFAETGGQPVPKRHPVRQSYRLEELTRLSERAGLPLTLAPAHYPASVVPASEAVISADLAGCEVAPLARAFLRAVWAQERDISAWETVAEIIAEAGIDAAVLAPHAAAASEVFKANGADALAAGVFGAPTYVLDGERFWGQDRLDLLEWRLSQKSPLNVV